MDAKQYGEGYQQHLLEQYKLMYRWQMSKCAAISPISFIFPCFQHSLRGSPGWKALRKRCGCSCGISKRCISRCHNTLDNNLHCVVAHLLPYRQLNSEKFKVIHEMESMPPIRVL